MSEDLNAAPSADEPIELPSEAEAPAPEQDNSGEDADAAPADAEPERQKQSAKDRIVELNAKRREAEREAEYWKAKALQTPAQEAQPKAQPQPQADPDPDPADYEHGELDVRFIRDSATVAARREFERSAAERDAKRQVQERVTTFDRRVTEQFPDGEPEGIAALRRLPQLSGVIQDVVMTVEAGPKIADHLGSNPRELQRISALPLTLQAFELAKLEAKLATKAGPAVKTVSDAPPATPQVRGTAGRFAPAPDTDDFAAFEKTYGN